MRYQLNLSGVHHEQLRSHLFPADGMEAVALALCGRYQHAGLTKLMISELVCIPIDQCERGDDYVRWSTDCLLPLLEKAQRRGMAILKIHSHPGGYDQFSETDDHSDGELFPSVFGWVDGNEPHASAVMLPDGCIFGRVFLPDNSCYPLNKVLVAGDQILMWTNEPVVHMVKEAGQRTAQAFGEQSYELLRTLKVGVVGCSGTGSPVVEQLARLQVGHLVLVDPDVIEKKNLNRILHSTYEDAIAQRPKVDVLGDGVLNMQLGTNVTTMQTNLYDNVDVLYELAGCDIVIGCMDSVDGRFLLNRLATFYIVPYLDLGVKLEADGFGGIKHISAAIHYLQPGKSSLMTRGTYDEKDVRSASEFRKSPETFADRVQHNYFRDVPVNRPAVVSVNMMTAAAAVCELLNRLHPYRKGTLNEYAHQVLEMTEGYWANTAEVDLWVDEYLIRKVGRGTLRPFLEMVDLDTPSL
ncbi:MAG: ThiF family adenylyltransferase [Chitinophagaceae bacterium]|nr:ThiF family adenylyltransferase [Chitinophagaceae bacterium]